MLFGEFKPVVSPRMYVRLLPEYGFYKVLGVEPIGQIIKNFNKTISGNSTYRNIEFTEVYMQENEMAQWKVTVLDDFEMRLKLIGRESIRGSTKYSSDEIATFSIYTNEEEGINQFFSFQDEKIYVDLVNPTSVTITKERIRLVGYKYKLAELEEEPEIWTDIPIGVVGSLKE